MDRRLFIAVPLTPEIKAIIEQNYHARLRGSAFSRLVHPDDYHITLFFLGATQEENAEALNKALSASLRDIPPFVVTIQGTGTFGRPFSPSIYWAGVGGDLEQLHSLQSKVSACVQQFGFTPEDRPYRAHITLARKWQSHEAFDASRFGVPLSELRMPVTRIVLYETHMDRKPSYEEIASFSLSP